MSKILDEAKKYLDEAARDAKADLWYPSDLMIAKLLTHIEQLESQQATINSLRGSIIHFAAFIACELQSDDITESQDRRFYKLIQDMKKAAKSPIKDNKP